MSGCILYRSGFFPEMYNFYIGYTRLLPYEEWLVDNLVTERVLSAYIIKAEYRRAS